MSTSSGTAGGVSKLRVLFSAAAAGAFLLFAGSYAYAKSDDLLQTFAGHGYEAPSKLLLSTGADIHSDDDAPLRWAAANGRTEMVAMLLNEGANIHAGGDFALRWAAQNGHAETVELLLERGAGGSADDYEQLIRSTMLRGHSEILEILQNHAEELGLQLTYPPYFEIGDSSFEYRPNS